MTLFQLAALTAAAMILGRLPRAGRTWGLFGVSLLILFWLQPATPLRYADFWLPAVILFIAVLSWMAAQPRAAWHNRENRIAVAVIFMLLLAIGLTRVFNLNWHLTATRPPGISAIAVAVGSAVVLFAVLPSLLRREKGTLVLSLVLVALFLILKTDVLATFAAGLARRLTGQDPALASPIDLNWLGFSYIAFRLLHTLRDQATGRLPEMNLCEYMTYVFFFPAIMAGPIDRAERFLSDLRRESAFQPEETLEAGKRIVGGILKKYVLASLLAVFSLNPELLSRVDSTGWLWILVYAYAFQLFLDFSGYTDVAVGIGMLAGVRLPENFDRPYRKQNLTAFWNSWHITLSLWFRAYFFNPLTRALHRRRRVPTWMIILLGQAGTMMLIGLWHGVTWNYLIWGAWHAFGLFVHNRWVALVRAQPAWFPLDQEHILVRGAGVFITFQFVSLGWLWFALTSPALAWETMLRMVGM